VSWFGPSLSTFWTAVIAAANWTISGFSYFIGYHLPSMMDSPS
jgi:hypothetical protein